MTVFPSGSTLAGRLEAERGQPPKDLDELPKGNRPPDLIVRQRIVPERRTAVALPHPLRGQQTAINQSKSSSVFPSRDEKVAQIGMHLTLVGIPLPNPAAIHGNIREGIEREALEPLVPILITAVLRLPMP